MYIMESEKLEVHFITYKGDEYIRLSAHNWLQSYGCSWEYLNDDEDLEKEFSKLNL